MSSPLINWHGEPSGSFSKSGAVCVLVCIALGPNQRELLRNSNECVGLCQCGRRGRQSRVLIRPLFAVLHSSCHQDRTSPGRPTGGSRPDSLPRSVGGARFRDRCAATPTRRSRGTSPARSAARCRPRAGTPRADRARRRCHPCVRSSAGPVDYRWRDRTAQ